VAIKILRYKSPEKMCGRITSGVSPLKLCRKTVKCGGITEVVKYTIRVVKVVILKRKTTDDVNTINAGSFVYLFS
jgi:hypothetical protein